MKKLLLSFVLLCSISATPQQIGGTGKLGGTAAIGGGVTAAGCSVTDSFVAVNGTELTTYSANWTDNQSTYVVETNAITPGLPGQAMAHYNACAFANNQFSQVTVLQLPAAGGVFFGPAVRVAASGLTGYRAVIQGDGTSVTIQKESGGETTLDTYSGTISINDVVRLEVTGSSTTTLTLKVNGSTVKTATDSSSPLTSGFAGISSFNDSGAFRLSPWAGGDI